MITFVFTQIGAHLNMKRLVNSLCTLVRLVSLLFPGNSLGNEVKVIFPSRVSSLLARRFGRQGTKRPTGAYLSRKLIIRALIANCAGIILLEY